MRSQLPNETPCVFPAAIQMQKICHTVYIGNLPNSAKANKRQGG